MKLVLHKNKERGVGEYGWLSTRYSFSFGEWHNPDRMGFGALRVVNDDVIAPNSGFSKHHHENMEIITIVTTGTLSHEDSEGNKGVVQAGDVQVMSAGKGIFHSEYNKGTIPLELFQIWILPNIENSAPRYDQKHFENAKENELALLVAGKNENAPLAINQDVFIYRGNLQKEKKFFYTLHNRENGVYIFVISGKIKVQEILLEERDALGISQTDDIDLTGNGNSQFLLFEIPLYDRM